MCGQFLLARQVLPLVPPLQQSPDVPTCWWWERQTKRVEALGVGRVEGGCERCNGEGGCAALGVKRTGPS